MCEGCIHWFIIDCGTLDSEPAVIRHWAMLCNYTDSVNDVISYLDKFSSWTGLNNCECICEFFVCFFYGLCFIIFNNIEMLFWNAEKTKLMLISVQVIKGRMPNKRGLNYCVYINIISQPCLPTSCEKNQQHKLLSYIYL